MSQLYSAEEDCLEHENEVNAEDDVQQSLTYLLELKEIEIGQLQVVEAQLEQENTTLQEEL